MAEINTIQEAIDAAQKAGLHFDENSPINQAVFNEMLQRLNEATAEDDDFASLVYLLSMPDEQFAILAPYFLEEYERSMNTTNNKLVLAQALNASGQTVEDYQSTFSDVIAKVEDSEVLSQLKKDFLKQIFSVIYNSLSDTQGIAKRFIKIPIEFCNENAKMPTYANPTDSGMDVYALDDITIAPGETKIVPTGIKVALPPGYELQVRPKSGRAAKTKLRIANTPGTIDAGYRDEIGVIIENVDPPIKRINIENWNIEDSNPVIHFSDIEFGQSYTIGKGEKFAQLVLSEVPKAAFYEVDTVSTIENDGRKGGFGSSGIK